VRGLDFSGMVDRRIWGKVLRLVRGQRTVLLLVEGSYPTTRRATDFGLVCRITARVIFRQWVLYLTPDFGTRGGTESGRGKGKKRKSRGGVCQKRDWSDDVDLRQPNTEGKRDNKTKTPRRGGDPHQQRGRSPKERLIRTLTNKAWKAE